MLTPDEIVKRINARRDVNAVPVIRWLGERIALVDEAVEATNAKRPELLTRGA